MYLLHLPSFVSLFGWRRRIHGQPENCIKFNHKFYSILFSTSSRSDSGWCRSFGENDGVTKPFLGMNQHIRVNCCLHTFSEPFESLNSSWNYPPLTCPTTIQYCPKNALFTGMKFLKSKFWVIGFWKMCLKSALSWRVKYRVVPKTKDELFPKTLSL